jgi:hypothetical protein
VQGRVNGADWRLPKLNNLSVPTAWLRKNNEENASENEELIKISKKSTENI